MSRDTYSVPKFTGLTLIHKLALYQAEVEKILRYQRNTGMQAYEYTCKSAITRIKRLTREFNK